MELQLPKQYAANMSLPKMPQERLLVIWQGMRGTALRQAPQPLAAI